MGFNPFKINGLQIYLMEWFFYGMDFFMEWGFLWNGFLGNGFQPIPIQPPIELPPDLSGGLKWHKCIWL